MFMTRAVRELLGGPMLYDMNEIPWKHQDVIHTCELQLHNPGMNKINYVL